ncbi:tetratricopeptide repeat protein [uncultured Treponema sp.]|uniref:tetratricopeptide repeat protein n=1 Tax=uncultured Treponema sp. TaxID=162155 RepID=UPI0025DC4CA1|nr:tetratricopeptide repeat protein [uncultured Treponema sp.]
MKRKFSAFIFFLMLGLSYAENKNLSAQMISSYKSAFYPGVVRFAEEILRSEKNSIASFRASVYEGESLFRMGRTEDALSVLESHQMNADSLNPESIQLNSARFFWLGRGYFAQKKFSKAQNWFFSSASIFRELTQTDKKLAENSTDYYALSMLFGAKCFIEEKNYKNAVPLYEYVISNGSKFSLEDYEDSALALAQSYNLLADKKSAQKCVDMISAMEDAKFDDETKYSLLILKGEAYENLAEYKKAYETYSLVIQSAPAYLAASAMQKAYEVSSAHKAEVGSEAGQVLSKAEGRLKEYPDLLSEFWTRLAVDAFYAKDYTKSLAYFDSAQENASDSQKEIAAIYRAEIAYITADEKSDGSKKALVILSEAVLTKSGAKNENILLSIARYNAYLKNWKESEKYASKCLNSENSDVRKNAVYWAALSKYESGDIKAAISEIENYKKDGKIEDKSILTVYAKSLAKLGKYHEADVIFYSLGEKNQLDNDGHLDYSRTLLIAGHYVSTKAEASKAKGDEAAYLSALASFNQHRWGEAESSFSKILGSKTLDKEYVAYALFYTGYAQYQKGDYSKSVASLNRFVSENPNHQFAWSALMTVARAAAFAKNSDEAISASQKAIKVAKNESEKNEATILAAGILSDSKKYDEALAILAPYIARRSEFGYECKYRSAEILVQQGKTEAADKYFAELASNNDKTAGLISEESAYRRAEIAYSAGEFSKAARLFEEYSKKWPSGRFAYASIYFSADSLAKSGNDTRAILRYLQITDSKAETSYRYGSEKNLVDLYQKTGEYEAAITMAQKMIDEYGSQALNDGMDKKIREIRQSNVWNKNSEEDKIAAAEKALARQKNEPASAESNMKNALYLASSYRSRGENKKSAEMYLNAAKYSRQAGNEENAARSFYGAIESFDAAALYADAKATFTEMKKLYPESKYTKDAEKIAGEL